MIRLDYFKLALAIAIVRAKPADVDISDYRLRVLERFDPTEFWKTKYNDTAQEVQYLRAQIDLLKTAIGKKRKRDEELEGGNDGQQKIVQPDPKVLKVSLAGSSSEVVPSCCGVASSWTNMEPNEQTKGSVDRTSNPDPDTVNSDISRASYMAVFMSDLLRESTRILLTNDEFKSVARIREHIHILEQYIAPCNDDERHKGLSPEYVVKVLGVIIFRLERVSFQQTNGRECEGTAGGSDCKIQFQECMASLLSSLLRGIALLSRRVVCNRDEGYENNNAASDDRPDALLAAYAAVILSTAARSPGLRKGIIILLFEHLRNILTEPHSLLVGASTPTTRAISNFLLQVAASNTARRYLLLLQCMTPRELGSEYSTVRYGIESVLFRGDGVGEASLGLVTFRQVSRSYCSLRWKEK
ncbi:hypothetical protein V1525DRAFT_396608 [Lipomyces kononenkoae]|uniref:Uncharacterized protein n=1 Tax=Lipomyces kononenkoae TaxID=34357 RepID=A0ACC3T7T5_LIPKO